MKHTNPTTAINNLIMAAQTAANEVDRDKAINELWELCGDSIIGIMAGKSYQMDSDFSLRGSSPKDRKDNLLGDAYFIFYNAVATFNLDLGVPFIAYTTQKSSWFLATEKRNNSKRSDREKCVDFSMESGRSIKDDSETARMLAILKTLASSDSFESDCDWQDAVELVYRTIKHAPKLYEYFTASLDLCKEGDEYSDAEVARHMGCTRASVGLYRKALIRTMKENGLLAEFTQLMAA